MYRVSILKVFLPEPTSTLAIFEVAFFAVNILANQNNAQIQERILLMI